VNGTVAGSAILHPLADLFRVRHHEEHRVVVGLLIAVHQGLDILSSADRRDILER
jgi:hypothetical protein